MKKPTKTTPNNKPAKVDMDGIEPSIFRRRWQILATLCASLLIVMLANSSLNLALPTLARELELDNIQLTWIVDIYSLVFASLLFTASAVADRYGRKKIMQIGLLIFLVGTVYAGFFAHTGIEVIISRGIMGLGGAMVMPTTLSIINNVFPRHERARAIAIWSGIAGGGVALGSIASGFLLEHFSWQSTFIFAAIVGVVGIIFNQILTPESRNPKKTPVDWLGGALSTVGLLGLVYGIVEAPSKGIGSADVIVALAIGVIGIAAFILWQLRTKHPMLDMKLFKKPAFSVSVLSVTLVFFALMGVFFSMSQMFQLVMGYGAMESSIRMLPIMAIMMFFSPVVPSIVKKFGARWTVVSGLLLVVVGFIVMSRWTVDLQYWQMLASSSILMAGMSLAMTPATNMLMSSVPRNRAGMGSAMNDTTRELGGALGVAVLGSVLSSVYGREIADAVKNVPAQAAEIAENSLAGALEVAKTMGQMGESIAHAAKVAWMNGLSDAMLIAAVIVGVAAIIAAIWLPHKHTDGVDDETLEPVTVRE